LRSKTSISPELPKSPKSHKRPQKATKSYKTPQNATKGHKTPNGTNFTETPQRHNHGERYNVQPTTPSTKHPSTNSIDHAPPPASSSMIARRHLNRVLLNMFRLLDAAVQLREFHNSASLSVKNASR
jgi:hypothetical protein